MADKLPAGPADVAPETGIYTETLARLYLRQGFLERAADIYRHLLQEQPENQQWQMQLRSLEQQFQQEGVETAPALSQAVVGQVPHPAPSHPAHTVIAQLERWLHYLQRQRTARGEAAP